MAIKQRHDQAGFTYHFVQKAVAEGRLFQNDADKERYVRQARTILAEEDASILVMGLLDRHLHGMVTSRTSLHSKVLQRLGTAYAGSYNRRYDRQGCLLGEPFWSTPILSELQFLATLRYVLRNPLEAGMVSSYRALERYPWTSLPALLGGSSRTEQSVAAVLAHFSPDEARAREMLRDLVRRPLKFSWFTNESDSSLTAELDRIENEAFKAVHEQTLVQRELKKSGVTLPRVIGAVCDLRGVSEQELLRKSRVPATCDARAVIAFFGVQHLGLSKTAVAKALRISQAAAGHATARGRGLAKEQFGDLEPAEVFALFGAR